MENTVREIYLDNAATSHPKPPEVLSAVADALTRINGNPGRSGHKRALVGARYAYACRETLAALLNAGDSAQIAFAFNCTDAINLAIKGIVPRGGHIVSTMLEHNSVLRVLEELRLTRACSYTLLSPCSRGFVEPEAFAGALRANTALIACTHASNVTGAILPVSEIGALAREKGLPFLIDGAQAAGCLPADVSAMGCALYAFPGHKALLGPQGTGGLYIRNGLRLQTLREGGTGTDSQSMRQPEEPPERYEAGTINLHGIAGLDAGARIAGGSIARTRAIETTLCAELIEELRALGGVTLYGPERAEARVGTVSFNMDDYQSSELADRLDERGIETRGGLHCAPMAHRVLGTLSRGAVRVSFGRSSERSDIAALITALREIRAEG